MTEEATATVRRTPDVRAHEAIRACSIAQIEALAILLEKDSPLCEFLMAAIDRAEDRSAQSQDQPDV